VTRRRWHLLGVGAAGLVLLGAATVVDGWLPDDTDDPGSDPFVRPGTVGEPVDLRTMTVQVDSVTGAPTLSEFGAEMPSPGLWVVVEYSVVPTSENTSVSLVELRDVTERVWSQVGRNSNDCSASPPGVTAGCVAYFEVPPEAVPGLRVRLARDAFELRYDAVADVDLGLTEADAARFAGTAPLEVPDTWLGERP
jgi:hypothetical protein